MELKIGNNLYELIEIPNKEYVIYQDKPYDGVNNRVYNTPVIKHLLIPYIYKSLVFNNKFFALKLKSSEKENIPSNTI